MKRFLDCWISVARALFSQALAGEPELNDAPTERPDAGTFGFTAVLDGEDKGSFTVLLDAGILETPMLGEGVDQRAGWGELLREVAEAATGEMLATTGRRCRVEAFGEAQGETIASRSFLLKSAAGAWMVLVQDRVGAEMPELADAAPMAKEPERAVPSSPVPKPAEAARMPAVSPGIELLLDVELEAALRFGCREMPLGDILDLGPGDVVELDRHIADPVDLIVGDKIVARGEVVLVNGNFGLRVTEVAEPRRRLESIRCLF